MRHDTRPLNTPHWRFTVRPAIAKRAAFRCQHCRTFLGMRGQVDHIVPRAVCGLVGIGVYDPSNLQYLCAPCHSKKSGSERTTEAKRPKPRRRTNVRGRDDFLNAAGIKPQEEIQC